MKCKCSCGYEFEVKIDAKGHNLTGAKEKITKEPTCYEEGEKTFYCSDCRMVAQVWVLDKLEHNLVRDFFPGSMKRSGIDITSCTLCNTVISRRVIPKITELLGQILTFLKDIAIGIILSVYFLLQKERFVAQGKRIARAIFRDGGYGRAIKLMKDIDNSFGGYLVAMGVDSFLVMCECFVVFAIANIPYYPLISFIVGVTNFIPFFGPFIGAIPSAIIIFIA